MLVGEAIHRDNETFLLPMIELPSGGVVHSAVSVRADAFLLQQVLDIIGVLEQFCLVGGLHHDGADDRLNRRHSWRKHETLHTHTMIITHDKSKNTAFVGVLRARLVVTVHHNGDTDGSGGKSPRGLPGNRLFALLVFILDLKHLAEVLSKIVAGCALYSSPL